MRETSRRRPIAILLVGIVIGVAALATPRLLASQDGACRDCLTSRFWRVSPDHYRGAAPASDFPEAPFVKGRPSIGLAFSGGGTRSAAATTGQLRALQALGWLEEVTYVSAVSGGSWAAIPYVFSPQALDELLGALQAPEHLGVNAATNIPRGALSKAIAGSSLASGGLLEAAALALGSTDEKDAGNLLVSSLSSLRGLLQREGGRLDKTYARLLGRIFIDPLIYPDASKLPFTWSAESLDDMAKMNPGLGEFVVARSRRPYLIVGGTLVSNRLDYDAPLLVPVEYTPLYVGARQQFGPFGGSYIWPWAYDSNRIGQATVEPGSANGQVRVALDQGSWLTLADVAASSGAAPLLALVKGSAMPRGIRDYVQRGASVFPAFRHFGFHDLTGTTLSTALPHADGGALDNLGVMPLLARGVKNIMVFVNTSTSFAERNTDLQSLFISNSPPDAASDKRFNVVFDAKHLGPMTTQLIQLRHRGEAQVYCDSGWSVKANAHYNIRPYDGVSICIFYNAAVPQWERQLECEMLGLLKGTATAKPAKHLENFPWFSTFGQNKTSLIRLTTLQVNLLTNLSAWTVANKGSVDAIRKAMPLLPPADGLKTTGQGCLPGEMSAPEGSRIQ